MIPILILAAGQSSRMRGADKLLEQVDGMPLLRQRAMMAVSASPSVWITLPALDHPRARTVSDLPVICLPVPDAASGMAASLRTGVAAMPDCARFMVLLADLPEITTEDLGTLRKATDTDDLIWRGTDQSGTPGHPIIFDSSLRPLFATLKGDNGGKEIIAAHRAKTRLIPLPGQHATIDLDTPEDWARWRKDTGR